MTAISVLTNRALATNLRGKSEEAEALVTEAARLRRELYGPSLALAAIEDGRARMLVVHGKPEAALGVTDEALPVALAFGGERSPVTIQLRQMRAVALTMLERTDEAIPEANRAIDAARDAFGERHATYANGLFARAVAHVRAASIEAALSDLSAADAIAGGLGAGGASLRQEIATLRGALKAAATAPSPEAP